MSSNSMLEAQSSKSVAARALMLNKKDEKLWIFVEGVSDRAVYSKFVVANDIRVDVAGSKPKAVEALKFFLSHRKHGNAVAIIDSDYDLIIGHDHGLEEIFYTDFSDLIVQAFESRALRYYVDRYIDNDCDIDKIRDEIYRAVKALGHLRLVSCRHGLYLKFPLNKDLLGRDLGDTIDAILRMQQSVPCDKDCLLQYLEEENDNYPANLVCQGHDVALSASAYFSGKVSKGAPSSHEKITNFLLAAYDSADFKSSSLYRKIHAWGKERGIDIFSI